MEEEVSATGGWTAALASGVAREDLTRGDRPAWGEPARGEWARPTLDSGGVTGGGRAAAEAAGGDFVRRAAFMSAVTARGEGIVTRAGPGGLPAVGGGAGANLTGLPPPPPAADDPPGLLNPWVAALICLARVVSTAAAEREEARGEAGAAKPAAVVAWRRGEREEGAELATGVGAEVGGVCGCCGAEGVATPLGVEAREGAGTPGPEEETGV